MSSPWKHLTQEQIVEVTLLKLIVGIYFNLYPGDLESGSRLPRIILAKSIYLYILRERYKTSNAPLSFSLVGATIGMKSHTTASRLVVEANNYLQEDEDLKMVCKTLIPLKDLNRFLKLRITGVKYGKRTERKTNRWLRELYL